MSQPQNVQVASLTILTSAGASAAGGASLTVLMIHLVEIDGRQFLAFGTNGFGGKGGHTAIFADPRREAMASQSSEMIDQPMQIQDEDRQPGEETLLVPGGEAQGVGSEIPGDKRKSSPASRELAKKRFNKRYPQPPRQANSRASSVVPQGDHSSAFTGPSSGTPRANGGVHETAFYEQSQSRSVIHVTIEHILNETSEGHRGAISGNGKGIATHGNGLAKL